MTTTSPSCTIMTTTIAVSNQKGGVGKTTTCISLAAFAAAAGRRCLVIDVDPQANTSSVLMPDFAGSSVFDGGGPVPSGRDGIDVVPSGLDLLDFDRRMRNRPDHNSILRGRIEAIGKDYDLIFIDCPPSLTSLPLNALQAADGVLIPIQCEYYAMEGLGQILTLIQELTEEGGLDLAFCKILLCMYEADTALSREVAAEIREHLPDQVLATAIPRDVTLAAAPSHNHTIIEHDPFCPGAIAYLTACKELLNVVGR